MPLDWNQLGLIGFPVAGLAICFYIWRSKRKKQSLVCPLNGGCMEVLNSKYSKTFGVSNEVMGALFYVSVILGAALLWAVPILVTTALPWLIMAASALAFLASLYLISIQLLVIKHTCTWCLTTAVINGTVLLFALQL